MRIGTWNLAGRWSPDHHGLLAEQDVDVWLLTEVNERTELDGYARHLGTSTMAARRRWAGVFSRDGLDPMPDPHPASAMACAAGLVFCSSILPWRGAWPRTPWTGERHADRTENAVRDLLHLLPTTDLVWGGDWNHALSGPEHAGSKAGRAHVLEATAKLDLQVPTAELPHRIEQLLSIDHIAVPRSLRVVSARRVVAAATTRLSDHDAYVVEVTR